MERKDLVKYLIVHFDLVGQKSQQKTNSKFEDIQLNLVYQY
ncbi:MAG: hypothetical protein WBQ32_12835 [Ignavibacteriaceae bacterium]